MQLQSTAKYWGEDLRVSGRNERQKVIQVTQFNSPIRFDGPRDGRWMAIARHVDQDGNRQWLKGEV